MKSSLSRKNVLRGSGVAMTLPWLESMAESKSKAPLRFIGCFQPNGVFPKAWDVEGKGKDYKFSPILKPLDKHRKHISILSNIDNKGTNGHVEMTSSFLSGVGVKKTGNGISLDQMIAQKTGHETLFPSIQLGTEPPRQGNASGMPIAYANTISWSSPFVRLSPEIIPRVAFDRLFAHRTDKSYHRKMSEQKSVLDLVLSDAKRLNSKISRNDQHKLEQYFESLRSVEKKIEYSMNPPEKTWTPKSQPNLKQPAAGLPRDKQTHLQSMIDLLVLALQTDSTRVATLMTAHGFSRQNFSFLDGVNNDHHGMSHHKNAAREVSEYTRVSTWYIEQLAYLITRLQAIDEGEGSLLDHSIIMYGSGMKDGNGHIRENLPLVLAGGGKTLRLGEHKVCKPHTPLSNLLLSLGRKFDLELDNFNGTSTGDLDHLI